MSSKRLFVFDTLPVVELHIVTYGRDFVTIAKAAFDPFVPTSGTEHVAGVLYSMTRMLRPASVLEYGSGYTTLHLLAALEENAADAVEEAALLRQKSVRSTHSSSDWFRSGGKACGIDPGFYLNVHRPHLYCIEKLPSDHEYSMRMTRTVGTLNLSRFLSYLPGQQLSADVLPPQAFPIDLAWNDDDQYMEFFETFWPRLNPRGGIMMFHNTVSVESSWNTINRIKEQRCEIGDLEILTLAEPHKLSQSSCTILRRTSEYKPAFKTRTHDQLVRDLSAFMRRK